MAVVAVLTAPRRRGLSNDDIAAAARLLGAGEGAPRRLGAAAAEIALETWPNTSWPRIEGVDLNVLPAEGRRKRLLIADMDSTIIPVECIDEIADFAGVKAEVSAITERAMAGELDFEGALRARVALMEGLAEAVLDEVYASRVTLSPGARALVQTMREAGAATLLVSGGFTFFAERVAQAAGFEEYVANTLLFEAGRLTGRVAEPILGRAAKRAALEAAAAEKGLGLDAALAVGDGANDLAMIEAAGLGVGYWPKPALAAKADAVLRHSDLDAVLALQGYTDDEILGL